MSLAIVYSRAQIGVTAPLVTVEAHLSNGLPRFTIVGLPETAVRESKDRVRSALINSGFDFPARKITVNLAPADLPKEGGRYDLPIAVSILLASRQLNCEDPDQSEFIGELALSGELRSVRGVLPGIIAARETGRNTFISRQNRYEAGLIRSAEVLAADHLLEVSAHLRGDDHIAPVCMEHPAGTRLSPDLADVRGQEFAKRALQIAAAGGHSLLMVGPPGTGKTMLASRMPGILPILDERLALQVAAVQSLVGSGFDLGSWRVPPFRCPHHSCSSAALVGGGSHPRPGEVSLAHNGVLFLDELPEFSRSVLDQLREPLESGVIHIARAALQVTFPARFQLIAAMNPCKCGWLGDPRGRCHCTEEQVQKYRTRISGPLLDRIDIQIEVPPVPKKYLHSQGRQGESSSVVRERVIAARDKQLQRSGCLNQRLCGKQLEWVCRLNQEARQLLDQAMDKLGLSARAYHRILRVARTVADLAGENDLSVDHVSEAVGYRLLDRIPYN